MSDVPPIRREVVVELTPDQAFEFFTAGIGHWWPLAEHSVFGAKSTVAFVDGNLVEASDDRTSIWGRVTAWDPGARVAFTWHPGREAEKASSVSVTFTACERNRTLVVLEHSGWEVFDDPATARDEYNQGWPTVLGRYQDAAVHRADPDAYTWVALMHRPGPAAPAEGSIFEDPRFQDHTKFLRRMDQAGYLVAAGPMLDESGSGMTILRLPGRERLDEAIRLATQEDSSVQCGLFEVSVRPWQVIMTRPAAVI